MTSRILKSNLLVACLLLLLGITATAGGTGGGGGSEEARMFSTVARERAILLLQSPATQRYGQQLFETLNNKLEIEIMPSLATVCDRKAGVTDYAYSCVGHIYLKQDPWANASPGKGWLGNQTIAETHIKDIIHEVFRASDPTSASFVTNDAGFSATNSSQLNLSTVEIVTEAMVDLRNLFANDSTTVNWQNVLEPNGGPEYLLRKTYSFPSGLSAMKQRVDYPAGESCYRGICNSYPAGFRIFIKFDDPRLKVTYQLIDPRTGRVVGRDERRMILSFKGDTNIFPNKGKVDHDPILSIADLPHDLDNYDHDFYESSVSFDLASQQSPGQYTLDFGALGSMWRRFENVLPIVEQSPSDSKKYILKGFDFSNATQLKVICYEESVRFMAKGKWYLVGAPESRFPTYMELYVKP